ncbi:L-idonate 5-dehydrogenase isoform X1 [Cryptomeria japonica]|uniref:L-idonate 5-dehydrogenase isoform X1 n=1 Tax=Cryptomeria japonica TaxID=3369 RepID=UPI0027DA1476|nr:L-idonate 5-dehydrogenase isoform X1 [Cryptomeria japonica]
MDISVDSKPRLPEGYAFVPSNYEQHTGNLAVYVCGFNDVRILPYQMQPLGPEDVRIQMKAVGICGSDVHYLKHMRNSRIALKEPMVLGHESAGIVVETGKLVKNLVIGDRVALEPGIPCNMCSFCKQGSNNLCRGIKFFGSPPTHGALAQQVVHPAYLCHKLPDNVSLEEGAMCEPLSVGVHACRRASIQAGTHVLILGAGPIGLTIMLVARAFGAVRVVLTDIDEKRLSTARELGADSTVLVSSDEKDCDGEYQAIRSAMGGLIDATFECVGTTRTMTTALKVTKSGGKVCLVGMLHDKMTLPLTAAAAREVDVLGIFRHRNTYGTCIELLQSKKIDIQKLITHRFGLSHDEVIEGFKASAGGGHAIKVMFNL